MGSKGINRSENVCHARKAVLHLLVQGNVYSVWRRWDGSSSLRMARIRVSEQATNAGRMPNVRDGGRGAGKSGMKEVAYLVQSGI